MWYRLNGPWGLFVDDDQTGYVADSKNHRVVKWECGATIDQLLADGKGSGNNSDQLKYPSDVVVDYGNHLVQKYSIDKVYVNKCKLILIFYIILLLFFL